MSRSRERGLGPILAALALVAVGAAAQISSEETIYLELWREPTERALSPDATDDPEQPVLPDEQAPRLLIAVGRPTVEAAPIAHWCAERRLESSQPVLPRPLLRDAPYDNFGSGAVPVRFEIAVDDVEVRYVLGTERPRGATGLEFPFYELCALGFGRREGDGWAVDVLHLVNHRGDEVALALYKGTLPPGERAYLEAQLGYSTTLEDPAGILLLGRGDEIQMLLLGESAGGEAFERLRRRIVR